MPNELPSVPSPNPDFGSALARLLAGYPFPIEGKWYHKQIINLDGFRFIRCRFDGCHFSTTKGSFIFENCAISDCRFFFSGEAIRVVKLTSLFTQEIRDRWPTLAATFHEDGTLSIN